MRNTYTYVASLAGALLIFMLPLGASAASLRPTCSLTITTEQGTYTTTKSEDITVTKGEQVEFTWRSKNAKEAENEEGDTIALTDTRTSTITNNGEYTFTFSNGSRKATCSAEFTVVDVSIDPVISTASRPTFTGSAEGMKSVTVTVRKEGTSKKLFEKSVRVKNGEWSVRSSKTLSGGVYEITLKESRKAKHAVATETVTVGSTATGSATVSVATIPLLTGGTVRDGATVPVSYLQVRNTGSTHATLSSFSVRQAGTAHTDSIASLTVVDSLGTTVGTSSAYPFKNSIATIPTTSTLAPGEMRLYTIKTTAGNTRSQLYKNLMLEVSAITLNGRAAASFPLRGTTWTLIP